MHKSEKGCTQRAEASREFLSPSLFSFLSFFFLRQNPKRKKKVFFVFHLLPHRDGVERVVDNGPRQRYQKS